MNYGEFVEKTFLNQPSFVGIWRSAGHGDHLDLGNFFRDPCPYFLGKNILKPFLKNGIFGSYSFM